MKMQFGVVMVAALFLTACGAPTPDGKQVASADQSTPAPKKKCASQTTGSRLGPCDASSSPDVQGTSGDAYRDSARTMTTGSQAPH
jgi:hypothetical protein